MSDPSTAPGERNHISRNCDEGRHSRCLGSVYVYPPEGGRALVACACPQPDCGHGTEVEKARRRG